MKFQSYLKQNFYNFFWTEICKTAINQTNRQIVFHANLLYSIKVYIYRISLAAPLPEWVPYIAQSPEEPQRESQQLLMLSAINFRLWLMFCSQLIHGKDTSFSCDVKREHVFFIVIRPHWKEKYWVVSLCKLVVFSLISINNTLNEYFELI